MNGSASAEGLPPVLRLHNWGNFPLPISLFHTASLAPSRTSLLLLSHRHEALLVPLGPSNSNAKTSHSSSPDCSVTTTADLKPFAPSSTIPTLTPITPTRSPQKRVPQERTETDNTKVIVSDLWSPPSFSVNSEAPTTPPSLIARRRFAQKHGYPALEHLTTPTYTPSSTPLFSFSPTSTGHSPALSPSCRNLYPCPSPLAVSSGVTFPSPFPFLSDIECFSWACSGDEFGANQAPGPFRELLLTGGKEGLIIHAFCVKEGIKNRAFEQGTINTREVHPSPDLGSEESDVLDGKHNGRWRNWGLKEFKRRQESWRRLEEADSSPGQAQESDQSTGRRVGRLNLHGSGGSLGIPKKGLEDLNFPRSYSEGATKFESAGSCSEESTGFESFVVDAKLEGSGNEVSLLYDKHHSWPASAEVVSFRIAHDTVSFSRLVSLAQKSSSDGVVDKNVLSSEKADGSTRLNDEYSLTRNAVKGGYEVTGIISSPSQNVVALLFASFLAESSEGSNGSGRLQTPVRVNNGNNSNGGRWRRTWKGSSDLIIIIANVHSLGVKWTSYVDFEGAMSGTSVPNNQWTDFKLSNDKFLGLTEGGCVYIWAAATGQFFACIDVCQFCGVNLGTNMAKIYSEGNGAGTIAIPREEVDGEVDGEGTIYCEPKSSKHLQSGSIQKFVQVMVTSDCLLIAITDERGLVFLVSVDDYFVAHPPLSGSNVSFPKSSERSNLKVLSSWEVAGSYIGCAKSIRSIPKHHVARLLSDRRSTVGRGSSAVDSSSKEDCIVYPVTVGASGFSSRYSHKKQYMKPLNFLDPPPKPLRKVFLPLNPIDLFVGMALNPYSITRVAINVKNARKFTLVQNELRISGGTYDEAKLGSRELLAVQGRVIKQHRYEGEVLSFTSQGCLYLVTATALHVVLPPLGLSSPQSDALALGCEGPWWPTGSGSENFSSNWNGMLPLLTQPLIQQWQSEMQDRFLIFDGLEEAERLCGENGWNLQLLRLRRLQLALDYLQIDDIEQALEGLVNVDAAEAGMPRVLFAAVELMLTRFGTDNELVLASRLLALAAQFSTRLVRHHGMTGASRNCTDNPTASYPDEVKPRSRTGVTELARFLEVIRTLQEHLQEKRKGRNRTFKMRREGSMASNSGSFKNRPIVEFPSESGTPDWNDAASQWEQSNLLIGTTDTPYSSMSQGALISASGSSLSKTNWEQGPLDEVKSRRSSPESAGEMFARWENTSVDAESVVRDALRAGRVPLAVVQLHRMRSRAYTSGSSENLPEMVDVFQQVQEIGKGIVYELLCKGKMALAMAALRRLGEDIEVVLHELAFGTVRRSLRKQAQMELHRHVRLGTLDSELLELTLYLERLYPHSCFWTTYAARQSQIITNKAIIEPVTSDDEIQYLQVVCDSKKFGEFVLQCGDVDGVVLGSWNTTMSPEVLEDTIPGNEDSTFGYLLVAAVWLQAWDQQTINRVILDRSHAARESVSWGSQLEYHLAHHNWCDVSTLLEALPRSVLHGGALQVYLDNDNALNSMSKPSQQAPKKSSCIPTSQEIAIRKVNLLQIDTWPLCSRWMFRLMEQRLAKDLIFLRSYWEGTIELVSLLGSAGILFKPSNDKGNSEKSKELILTTRVVEGPTSFQFHKEAIQGVHEVVVRHCVKMSFANLLEQYLDYHGLGLKKFSSALVQFYVGDCEWAKWLLLSRLRGQEYDASFANARSVSDSDCLVKTVDDMAAEGKGLTALTTLMYAPVPLQKCLSSGLSRDGMEGPTWQCSHENLREVLQGYPTLWQALVAASNGHDAWGFYSSQMADPDESSRGLPTYLQWRDKFFTSVAGDVSLLHIFPRWLPKSLQRLLQLTMKGPGGDSQVNLVRMSDLSMGSMTTKDQEQELEESLLEWEAGIQEVIKQELHASPAEEIEPGVEHYLRRGRALAAFNTLLAPRSHTVELQSEGKGKSPPSPDLQALLASLSENEEALIASIYPLAITNFENTIVAAACAVFLELCGLSAEMLRVDIAALQRISKFLRIQEQRDWASSTLTKHPQDISAIVSSLGRALTEEYSTKVSRSPSGQPAKLPTKRNKGLTTTLQMLEKATLLDYGSKIADGTSGSWLLNAKGNGAELRELQRSLSEKWSLVTAFCRGHKLPLSTTYLETLACDNDWVGFLAEAQVIGCPLDVLVTLAMREFKDPRLKCHIVTVLKSIPLAQPNVRLDSWEISALELNAGIKEDLFSILAACEKHKSPSGELLVKSKELQWPLLAVLASCFDDANPIFCLTTWLEIAAASQIPCVSGEETTDAQITAMVGAAVEATNVAPTNSMGYSFKQRNSKRQRCGQSEGPGSTENDGSDDAVASSLKDLGTKGVQGLAHQDAQKAVDLASIEKTLSALVAVLCEKQLFHLLLQAFELFTPESSILSFIKFLQAFSQMRLTDASIQLSSFSALLKEETNKRTKGTVLWISKTAVAAADAMLEACPSVYEQRCLLQLLLAVDFCDAGVANLRFRRCYWKLQLVEPSLRSGKETVVNGCNLGDEELLESLEASGQWDEGRTWARQLDSGGQRTCSALHHVTETQAEAMVAEWKELLWDVQQERAAVWGHCQALFIRHSFPPLQAGTFFLRHADAVEGDVSTIELHGILLLAFKWLSGSFTNSSPMYPIHQLHELEIRIWLLAVEAEVEMQNGRDQDSVSLSGTGQAPITPDSPVDNTAHIVEVVDKHLRSKFQREVPDVAETASSSAQSSPQKLRRKLKHLKHTSAEIVATDVPSDVDQKDVSVRASAEGMYPGSLGRFQRPGCTISTPGDVFSGDLDTGKDNPQEGYDSKEKSQQSDRTPRRLHSGTWEERIREGEVERAVLALVEVGQVMAAKQLQQKLSPAYVPLELLLVEDAQKVAMLSVPAVDHSVVMGIFHTRVVEALGTKNLISKVSSGILMEVLDALTEACREGCGRGLCKRIAAVAHISNFLGIKFAEAFQKPPLQLLQLLSLKGHQALREATLLVNTHSMAANTVARILAETFYKGLAAAHRGGFSEMGETEEGPGQLLWRVSEFREWAKLCPSEPEIGHALMRLVISGRDMPHSCEVNLLILAHQYYESSGCLDGLDVLVGLAANRVDTYVAEADFVSLALLVIGLNNLQALRFVLDILIENGQLEMLLEKTKTLDTVDGDFKSKRAIQGFRMGILSSLYHFSPQDQDAFTLVYNRFQMDFEMAGLLKTRAQHGVDWWVKHYDPELSEELLDTMRLFMEAAENYSHVDAGRSTSWCCAQASMVSLQLRMPELMWLNLTDTNARRLLVEQPRFPEALVVAEAYGLNASAEWVPVLWNQILQPNRLDYFLNEFVAVLPLPATMLMELARFYRNEVSARGYQMDFTKWLTPGVMPMEHSRHLGKSMRILLKHVPDIRLRLQLATLATGFSDIVDSCFQMLDKVPDVAGPLILRKGHGGTYVPLM